MNALNFLRELLCFILLSTLFQMLVALKLKVRWPEEVLQRGIWSESRLRVKRSWIRLSCLFPENFIEYRLWICICSWKSGERKRCIKQLLPATRGLVICAECDLLVEESHNASKICCRGSLELGHLNIYKQLLNLWIVVILLEWKRKKPSMKYYTKQTGTSFSAR